MKNTIEEQEVGGAVRGYRSGVAARLAGLAAATLRVWERRYRLTDAPRTANGQRLYTPEQVRRLGLLKQLVDQGHPIGTLAALPSARLRAMSGGQADGAHGVHGVYGAPGADGAIAVAAIGAGLLRRLASAIEDGLPLRLHDGAAGPAAVLLVELAEPDDTALASLRQARAANRAGAVIVLYRFCASATVRTLRADGFMVARFPGEMGELPLLCRAALQARRALPAAPVALDRAVRFDEATLAASTVGAGGAGDGGDARHDSARALAEMLRNLGSFERYSASCAAASSSLADAALHGELEDVAGRARELLEQAMGRLLQATG